MTYQIGDFIIRLKNACMARRKSVIFSYSKINKAIGDILVKERFLESITEEIEDGKKTLVGNIRYEKRKPALIDVVIVSKPSLRIYTSAKNVGKKNKGFGIDVLSTSVGILTGKEAKKKQVGGELLFTIW